MELFSLGVERVKKVILYHLLILASLAFLWVYISADSLPDWMLSSKVGIDCTLSALLGGNLYCLRAIYLNRSVQNRWNSEWEVWYYLRPIASAISGVIAYILLRAGLIVLEASPDDDSSYFGFLTFAFIAGLNVDKFVVKLEEIARATFGIEISRVASGSSSKESL